MQVTRTSPLTGKEHTLELPITDKQMSDWAVGIPVQDAFPQLTPDQREFIRIGLAPGEFEEVFGRV